MSYISSLKSDISTLSKRLESSVEALQKAKDNKTWFQINSEINSIRVSIKAKKQRIRFHGKFPHMPETFNISHLQNLTR